MYESPIKIYEQIGDIISEFTKQRENLVFESVAKVGIDVDKNELIRALQYDREQYSKGYSDGKADGAREFAEWCYINGKDFSNMRLHNEPCYVDIALAEWQKGKEE